MQHYSTHPLIHARPLIGSLSKDRPRNGLESLKWLGGAPNKPLPIFPLISFHSSFHFPLSPLTFLFSFKHFCVPNTSATDALTPISLEPSYKHFATGKKVSTFILRLLFCRCRLFAPS